MGKNCCICHTNTIFFKWSTTRDFPIDKLAEILFSDEISRKHFIKNNSGVPICISCCNTYLEK
jgi:hypothetical protein